MSGLQQSSEIASHLVKVPVSSLQPGWVADRHIYSGSILLLSAGTKVTSGIIVSLKFRNIEFIEIQSDSQLAKGIMPPPATDQMAGLIESANEIYERHLVLTSVPPELLDEAGSRVEGLFEEARTGSFDELVKLRPLIKDLVLQLRAQPRQAVKHIDESSPTDYLSRHSVNVCLHFMRLAQDMCASDDELVDLSLGAVLHDIGFAKIDPGIVDKHGPLDDGEWERVREHPALGDEMLSNIPIPQAAREIALGHHERLDGSGYPNGLTGGDLGPYVRLAAICDVYDAVSSARTYKDKLDFCRAVDVLIHDAGANFDSALVHRFIRKIGRYPVGSFVRLSSGEVGVVKQVNPDALWRPVISRVLDPGGRGLDTAEALDLSECADLHIVGIITGGQLEP